MIGPWNKIGFRQIAFGGGGGGGGTNTPLETTISNQPHALAYITPSEEGLLRSLGGTGQAGPGGVPAFPPASIERAMDRNYNSNQSAGTQNT
jgi:hypothetical protein